MKYDVYFIINYWRIHWRRALVILSSYVILAVFVFTSFSMVRTEMRRQFVDSFNKTVYTETGTLGILGNGAYNMLLNGIDEDMADALDGEELVGKTGRFYTKRYLGNETGYFTYGAYMDEDAYELSGIRLVSGRFPKASGETAISELALSDMGIDAKLGSVLALTEYDGSGNAVREWSLTLTGILMDEGDRRNWETYASQRVPIRIFEPVILVSGEDMDRQDAVLSMMLRYNPSDSGVLTKEQEEGQYHILEKYMAASAYGGADGAYDSTVFIGNPEDEILKSGKSRFYQYACTAAAVVMVLSLVCSLLAAMPGHLASMEMLHRSGCPRWRLRRMLCIEWAFFTLVGLVAGFLAAVGVYEGLLQVQHRLFGLEICRAWQAEWGIRQITFPPGVMTLFFMLIGSVISFGVPVLGLGRMLHQGRKRGRRLLVRTNSFQTGIWKVFWQPAVQALQALSLMLVLVVGCMATMFFSIRGKEGFWSWDENPQFTNMEMSFQTNYDLNMLTEQIDCTIYRRSMVGGGNLIQIQVPEEGLEAEYVSALSESPLIRRCYAWSELVSLYAYYGEGEKVPRGLARFDEDMFNQDAGEKEWYGLDGQAVYGFKAGQALIVNDEMLDVLGADTAALDQGKAFLLYMDKEPFHGISEPIPCYSAMTETSDLMAAEEFADIVKRDTKFPLEFAGSAPMDAAVQGEQEHLHNMIRQVLNIGGDKDYAILFSHAGAQKLGLLNGRFHYTYLTYADGTEDSDVRRLLDGLNLRRCGLGMTTLSQMQERYNQMKLKENIIVFTVFGLFILLSLTGYIQALRLQISQRQGQLATLRAVGAPKKRLVHAIVLVLLVVPLFSIALGAAATSQLQGFLQQKGERIIVDYRDAVAFTTDNMDPVYIEAYNRRNEQRARYLTCYEMWKVPIWGTFAALAAFILICVLAAAYLLTSGAVKREIIPEKEE